MSRACDYFLASAEHEGASLFPSGLLMYDLPSSRRRGTSQRSDDPNESLRKRSPISTTLTSRSRNFLRSSSSSSSSNIDEENSVPNQSIKTNHLTTSEDWWREAMRSDSFDGDEDRSKSSHFPPCSSSQRLVVHNRPLLTLNEIYSDKIIAHVKRWYERHSLPQLNLLIKRGLLKTFKDKSIRMSIGTKKEIYAQLDQHGKILSAFDNRQFDTIELFYRSYQSRRKQNDSLIDIYQHVRWYDQTFHSIILEYAEHLIKTSGFQTRLVQDDELFDDDEQNLSKEILSQIDCWTNGRTEIDL